MSWWKASSGIAASVFLALLLSSCGRREPVAAVGANDEISVFTNTAPNGPVVSELRRLFVYPVDVVNPERAFRLDLVPFSRFHVHQYVKNQIFAVDLSRDEKLAGALPGMLGGHEEGRLDRKEPFLLLVHDLWATGQTSLFAIAWSEAALLDLLAGADSTAVRLDFERSVAQGLSKTMFSLGEETAIPAQVARAYGWTMRLPSGFFAAEKPEGRLVKFNADSPVRLILVHWLPEDIPLTADAWEPILARTLLIYNDGDEVLAERTRVFPDRFQGQPALKWEGIWQNEKYVIGGPFRAYAFHREGTSYLVVGILFAPGQDKVYALRQLEGMMHTFRIVP
jgi:hypothetical protein